VPADPSCVEPELDELLELPELPELEPDAAPLEPVLDVLDVPDVLDVLEEPVVEARAMPATASEAAMLPTTSVVRTAAVRRRPLSLGSMGGVLMTPP
jgi:hypothetical protein